MWNFFNKTKIDLLEKTQENLESTQKNNELLAAVLTRFIESTQPSVSSSDKSSIDKLKAAYALNLCTVSVSQIIDYNDLGFLESEYDAILNNLNIEEMPKDEALLRIMKQLLDVITFFRIQEGDRKLMEEEYEHRIKNAIWSAVPNIGLIATGGNPVTIAVSLASQIGIGYMNYRKEKAKIGLEKKRSEWELQRSAVEQFNGLRRELFDTAWRLAEEYSFPDEYRITERQISQYNSILMDTNDMRRYERLDYIKNNFSAYPPFWYYLGSAANAVYQNLNNEENVRLEYKKKALEHFDYFLKTTEHNLLREDQLVASCALEKFDLIEDKEERISLLRKAVDVSGNAFDVLQLCVISYLKIGELDEASLLLRMLINENYNEKLNSQLLSRIYVYRFINGDSSYKDKYMTIASRVLNPECLFPIPDELPNTEVARKKLDDQFIKCQKENLLKNYAHTFGLFVKQSEKRYIDICKGSGNIIPEISALIKDICRFISLLTDDMTSVEFLNQIHKSINKDSVNDDFTDFFMSSEERNRGNVEIGFSKITKNAFEYVAIKIRETIELLNNMEDISNSETILYEFRHKSKLESEIVGYSSKQIANSSMVEDILFGNSINKVLHISEKSKICIEQLRCRNCNKMIINEKKSKFIVKGDVEFNSYWQRNKSDITTSTYSVNDVYLGEVSVIAVLNDTSIHDTDIIFTTEGVIVTGWMLVKGYAKYKDIKLDYSGKKIQIGMYNYKSKFVKNEALLEIIDFLAKLSKESEKDGNEDSLSYQIENIILNS